MGLLGSGRSEVAVINRDFGYLFLAEPYCASRSIEAALLKHPGSQKVDAWMHATKEELLRQGRIGDLERLYSFSVVRHPADVLVTRFHHLTGWKSKGFQAYFEDCLRSPPFAGGRSIFMHPRDVDQTVSFERLSGHLNALLDAIGAPPVMLESVGKTPEKKPWRVYYETGQLDQLAAIYRDFADFGYAI